MLAELSGPVYMLVLVASAAASFVWLAVSWRHGKWLSRLIDKGKTGSPKLRIAALLLVIFVVPIAFGLFLSYHDRSPTLGNGAGGLAVAFAVPHLICIGNLEERSVMSFILSIKWFSYLTAWFVVASLTCAITGGYG
jgi:hypothetical protein